MILFKEDYQKYPGAIIDTKTTNESALKLARVYMDMGIENAFFHLTLMQPDLQGVDPYDPFLTEDMKIKIGLECQFNPWYFFREVVRIPPQAGMVPGTYRFNRANVALYFSFFNHIDFALIMPRQLGKSLGTDILMVWLMHFGIYNSKINMLTKDNGLRVVNVERIKRLIDLLPSYLTVNEGDLDNQQIVTYNHRKNKYLTSVAQSSEAGALNVGRGLTSPIVHIDEGPFIKFIGTIIPALLASGTAAREEAERNGMPFANIFTTTAGKKDDRDGKYMYDLIHGGAIWKELYLDLKDQREFEHVVNKNSKGKKPLINGTFSHLQVGKDNDWLRKVLANTNAVGEEADRDFFNIWTSGTLRSPLSPKLNDLIKDSEMEPVYVDLDQSGYIFNWFVEEDERDEILKNGRFVLGMDTSELVGRDDLGMVLLDVTDMSVVGTAAVNETNILAFAKYVAKLMVKFPTITLNIERKSTGITFIDALLLELPANGIDPFTRMFNTVVQDAKTDEKARALLNTPMSRRDSFFYEGIKTKFGFVTTAESRKVLYVNVLPELAKRAGGSVRCEILSSQIRALVVKNGRIDHTSSGHDDMVISWLLAGWLVMKGVNLQHYGIDPRMCMAYAGNNGNRLTEEDKERLEEQKQLRDEIQVVKDELLRVGNDHYERVALENRLRYLTALTTTDGGGTVSFDALIEEVREKEEDAPAQKPKYQFVPAVQGDIEYC